MRALLRGAALGVAASLGLSASLALSGCPAGPTPTGPDAGDAGPDATPPTLPTQPAPPALPVLTPCPEGWREVPAATGTALVTCDPWPEGGPSTCADDEAWLPGGSACARIGPPCPAGSWAEDLPTEGEVIYVLAGAPGGGDGTEGAPLGTIAEALSLASAGSVIALGRGVYDEAVDLGEGVTLWGACVAETVVASPEASSRAGTITVRGRDTAVRNLQVRGDLPGVWVVGPYSVDLEAVVVDGATMIGLMVARGGGATGREVLIRGTRSAAAPPHAAHGVHVEERGEVELVGSVIEGSGGAGVMVLGSAARPSISLVDAVVRDTRGVGSAAGHQPGFGLYLLQESEASVTRSVFERNAGAAIAVASPGTELRLVDVVLRETRAQEHNGNLGGGLSVLDGASAELERVLVEDNLCFGLWAIDPGSSLRLADVVVRRTVGQASDGDFGVGLIATFGPRVEAARVLFEENHWLGVSLVGPDCTAQLEDLVVRETGANEGATFPGFSGRGLQAEEGAVVTAVRLLVEGNQEAGVVASGAGTELLLEDAQVRETRENSCLPPLCDAPLGGIGLAAYSAGHLEARRFVVTENELCGVQLSYSQDWDGTVFPEGGTMDLHDGVVSLHVVGANVQTAGFDVERLMDGVVYLDNDRNLDATELPVPQATPPLEP